MYYNKRNISTMLAYIKRSGCVMKKIGLIALLVLALGAAGGCTSNGKDSSLQEKAALNTESSSEVSGDEVTNKEEVVKEEKTKEDEENAKKEYYVIKKFESQALAKNKIKESTEKEVYVYLPPSYYDSDKNYPVVYYLHGYMEYSNIFVFNNKSKLDDAFKNGAKEFVLVGVNGMNKLGGSFYTNSPVTGNWEDYVAHEVVAYVDSNFRTIKDRGSRGICGFSMGGYGAYNLALKHPDVFGSLLTMSPGLLAEHDLPTALSLWDMGFKTAYAQAFSPNVDSLDKYGNIPELSGTQEDNAIIKDWESGFGNIKEKVDNYIALRAPLKAIKILYGEQDAYLWIPTGCKYLATYLDEKGIDYSIESFPYGHVIHPQAVENQIIPFFNQNLEY